MKAPTKSVDITRLNRKERRQIMKGDKMRVMIPGRHLPYVKKTHGEIRDFYALRDKEVAEETKQRQQEQVMNAARIGNGLKLVETSKSTA